MFYTVFRVSRTYFNPVNTVTIMDLWHDEEKQQLKTSNSEIHHFVTRNFRAYHILRIDALRVSTDGIGLS